MFTEHDPTDDSETSRAHAKAMRKIDRQQELEDLRAIMATRGGRRWVYRVLAKAGIHRSTFRGEQTHDSAWLEGHRDFGIFVEDEVNEACPNHYLTMLKEHTRG